ncbi:LysR family transcriptional regulator [Roseivivax sediminis]|uniref:DNA-binding transcriptional regulator, LysR family n=1 Tax=Roseivivax sediminis TaxID=936889 RepID=A0A1I2CEA1_9RHOB|nr:LysR family transcriptional regulator [Roseivivax sediminis]SFE66143.1 DNA-binding transcriptional regulator, LysR family [Roseivivax sediminis]
MKDLSLDALRLFLAVADAGRLEPAARATGVSAPTLSRRMAALERQLGARLFERGAQGYRLTAHGRDLAEQAADLRGFATRLDRFAAAEAVPRVRITAGLWTSRLLARHLPAKRAGWVPEMLASNAQVDIARREADIGVRNRRPDQPWLAGRVTATIRYAVFAVHDGIEGYIALPRGAATAPSERWLRETHAGAITTTASDMGLAREMARAGIGRVVLPIFAAGGLVQIGAEIDALAHEEWLVAHHDARHDPPVRAALETVAAILTDVTLRP